MIAMAVTRDLFEANKDAILAWITDHGLEPKDVPLPSIVTIDDGMVTVETYVRGQGGGTLLTAARDDAYRAPTTVPLKRAWPLEVQRGA